MSKNGGQITPDERRAPRSRPLTREQSAALRVRAHSQIEEEPPSFYARLHNSSLALEGSVDGASVEKLRWLNRVLESGEDAADDEEQSSESRNPKPPERKEFEWPTGETDSESDGETEWNDTAEPATGKASARSRSAERPAEAEAEELTRAVTLDTGSSIDTDGTGYHNPSEGINLSKKEASDRETWRETEKRASAENAKYSADAFTGSKHYPKPSGRAKQGCSWSMVQNAWLRNDITPNSEFPGSTKPRGAVPEGYYWEPWICGWRCFHGSNNPVGVGLPFGLSVSHGGKFSLKRYHIIVTMRGKHVPDAWLGIIGTMASRYFEKFVAITELGDKKSHKHIHFYGEAFADDDDSVVSTALKKLFKEELHAVRGSGTNICVTDPIPEERAIRVIGALLLGHTRNHLSLHRCRVPVEVSHHDWL